MPSAVDTEGFTARRPPLGHDFVRDDEKVTPRRLSHGYTNQSWTHDGCVVKQYDGVDAQERLRTEVAALVRAATAVPVPEIKEVDERRNRIVLAFMAGRHGQELIEEGSAEAVLKAAGSTLRRLHQDMSGLVHGDYGPQNLLVDTVTWEISAVLDWEFAHPGDPLEDLAWAEWIVRMHHPAEAGAVSALFEGYGSQPAWPLRQVMMQEKCLSLAELCRRRGQGAAVDMWRMRARVTGAWRD